MQRNIQKALVRKYELTYTRKYNTNSADAQTRIQIFKNMSIIENVPSSAIQMTVSMVSSRKFVRNMNYKKVPSCALQITISMISRCEFAFIMNYKKAHLHAIQINTSIL